MDKENQLIPDVTPLSKNWLVRITVTEDIPVMHCSTGSKLKRYVFADVEGNEIIAAIYDPDVDTLSPMIKLYGVYDISNADVKVIDQKYRILNSQYQWNIRRNTLIKPIPEATPKLQQFPNTIMPLAYLSDAVKNGIVTADIMAIVIDADEVKKVSQGRTNVQHFTVMDTEMVPIRVSLWEDAINSLGPALIKAAKDNAVLLGKGLSIRTFDAISLSSKNSSSFAIDPPIQATRDLKSWFKTITNSQLQLLKSNNTIQYTRELVSAGRMRTYRVADLQRDLQVGKYWVRGYLRLINQDQQLYYIACSKCSSKIKADVGHCYTCFLCKKSAVASLRLFVVLDLIDETGIMEIVAIDKVAEKVLQTTIVDMSRLHNLGHTLELDSIKAEFQTKKILVFVSKTASKGLKSQRRLLLESFFDDSTPATTIEPSQPTSAEASSSSNRDTELPISPLKRQLSEIIITRESPDKKQLTWFDDTQNRMAKEAPTMLEIEII